MDPLPKEELLIKLLKMTTSPNDAESLVALRKANELLRSAGWDWEKLVRGKITVIADPFKDLAKPPESPLHHPASYAPTPPPAPIRPYAGPATAPKPPPPPPLVGSIKNPLSTRPNLFAGHCHCCGIEVVAKAGQIFQSHNSSVWKIACNTCNVSATVSLHPSPPQKVKRRKSISDLA